MTTYNKDVLLALLETLNPPARAIVIGGGFGGDEVQAVREIASGWDKGKVEVVAVPKGNFDREGPAGILNYQRRELDRFVWEVMGDRRGQWRQEME
jgi:hypothetical protein